MRLSGLWRQWQMQSYQVTAKQNNETETWLIKVGLVITLEALILYADVTTDKGAAAPWQTPTSP